MRSSVKLALVLLASAPLVQGCTLFGGGEKPRHYASETNPACARLKPLVTNPNGDLSKSEMEAALQALFKKADVDGSGELSMTEVAPTNDALRGLNVGAAPVMDVNGDGRINFQEFASGWRTMFQLCAHGSGDVVSQNDMQNTPRTDAPVKAPKSATKPGQSTDTSSGSTTGGHVPGH